MNLDMNAIFTDDEKDILQEVMNIAFGNATADLAGIIDIYVVLSIPNIQVISIGSLPDYLRETIDASNNTNIVDQKFWGDFSGSGFLVFPSGASDELMGFLEEQGPEESRKHKEIVESEVLTEIGNILIGACVGKMSELLNTFVTYSPPRVIRGGSLEYNFLVDHFDPGQPAIVMKTVFKFKEKDINGFLMILTNQDSIGWLRKSLQEFMGGYE
ncbi:MAG: chemotaxis protein CheC [Thermodesulfobacteriota bacterium]